MVAAAQQTERWLERATVRNGRMPVVDPSELVQRDCFSVEQVPIAIHPLIVSLGAIAQRELLRQHLFMYMEFTDQLELKAVNPVAQRIAHGEMDVLMSEAIREEAHSTYTDEAWHAQVCANVLRQIRQITSSTPACIARPVFLDRLEAIQSGLAAPLRDLSQFLFVVVSETMISGTLSKVPKDPEVVSAVRQMLFDHASDEGRHHKFFSVMFETLWPALSTGQKRMMGPNLPRFVRAFIDPDTRAIGSILARLGLNRDEIHQVVAETYLPSQLDAAAREASWATLALFERNGVLEHPRTRAAFVENGLIVK